MALAADQLEGGLVGRTVLVIGAGEMGAGFSKALAQPAAPARVVVANRSAERAAAVAGRSGAEAVSLSRLDDELGRADIVLTSTAAVDVVLDVARISRTMRSRPGRPLLVVDVAVPRDVDPAVADLEGVRLLDVEDVRRFAEAQMSTRRGEIPAVRAVLTEELERYRAVVRGQVRSPGRSGVADCGPSRSAAPSSTASGRGSMRSSPRPVRSSRRSPSAPSPSSSTSRRYESSKLLARGAVNGLPRRCATCSTCKAQVATLRIATRGSPLALRQAELVADALAFGASSTSTARVTTELVVVETAGDLHRDRPIGAIGGQGAFVTEVEQALIDGRGGPRRPFREGPAVQLRHRRARDRRRADKGRSEGRARGPGARRPRPGSTRRNRCSQKAGPARLAQARSAF